MVTKELAKYAREEGLYWFHITSLKLTNPENAPDRFEQAALLGFENDDFKELMAIETINRHPYLRYISPLYVEEACLPCHYHQDYQIGDVRGAISITLPLSDTMAAAARNRKTMFAAMLLVVALLSGAMMVMMRQLVLTPIQRLAASIKQFSEGRSYEDTALPRSGDELEDLGRAFAEMAARLVEYHHGLEDKIKAATLDLETANRQLSVLNERKSDFVIRASHELRTPLTSIQGSLEYVNARFAALPPAAAEGCRLDELRDFLALIQKNTDRLIRLVNTMLDLEKIETNAAAAMHPTWFDLTVAVRESFAELTVVAERQQVRLTAQLPSSLPVFADEDRIRQVLINLLANALKFAPVHSTITVAACLEGGGAMVAVTDQGPGVPGPERDKIFQKFYKSGLKEGFGMGLAICRSIIEAHGGTIGVTEPDTGTGARLFFILPQPGMGRGNIQNCGSITPPAGS
jgi:signal transduction histidine kinase